MDSLVKPVSNSHLQPRLANLRVHHLDNALDDDLALIRKGLSDAKPWLHPKFFYDSRGSRLFDAITETPEYYPTRTEASIFSRYTREIMDQMSDRAVLVEPGSGNCAKALKLLSDERLNHYAPIEISRSFLVDCCTRLAANNPALLVDAVCGDFTRCQSLPGSVPADGRVVFFPGSTIGNFDPDHAQTLLENFHELADGGYLLIGADLPKDRATLERAYNDSQGITAQFNLNMLSHLSSCHECKFTQEHFEHLAFYNAELKRIEMHLVCKTGTAIQVQNDIFTLTPGQSIHTESSYKYDSADLLRMARSAGFEPVGQWTDSRDWFAVYLLRAA